jgi:GTPase SAR1 family protein
MNNFAVFVIGPAGSGKTTLVTSLAEHALAIKRNVQIMNLDPAVKSLPYEPTVDIRDFCTLQDIMEDNDLGPNGGLIKCFTELSKSTFIEEALSGTSGEFFFIDCPGQIEIYMQSKDFRSIIDTFSSNGYTTSAVYALDCTFVKDNNKWLSGAMNSLIATLSLGLQQINVLTKVDLVSIPGMYEEDLMEFLSPDWDMVKSENVMGGHLIDVLQDFSLTEFFPVTVNEMDQIKLLLNMIDMNLNYENEDITLEDCGGEDE